MTKEIYNIIRNNLILDGTYAEIKEAFDEAENAGFVHDGWSNNPSELIGFINGYIIGNGNGKIKSN